MTPLKPLLLATLTVFSLPALADTSSKGQFSLSTGATYTSGDYGSSDTTQIWYVPVSLKYKQDRWNVKLTIPYLNVRGPSNVIRDIGQVSTTTTQVNTQDGLGDISLSGSYRLFYLPESKTLLDINGKIKFGTADENRNLGTGKNDYSLSFGLYELLGDYTPYLVFGRKFYGESSQITLNDVYFGSVGLSYKVSDKTNIGADLYLKEKTASWRDNTRQLSTYFSYKMDKNWKIQTYLIGGISDNTPDYGGGFSTTYAFD